MKTTALLTAILLISLPSVQAAKEREYSPGGARWAKTWRAFYAGDHEEELMNPLIKAGPAMAPALIEAISHKDMSKRRYAISALAYLKDRNAVEPLTRIVKDKSEEEYFRADALHAIYVLDRKLGEQLAKQFAGQGDTLKTIAEAIRKKEPWLMDGHQR
jgi:HEAT repeat protein